MKLKVKYTVEFEAEIEVDDDAEDQDVMDACGDVDIPEGGADNSKYVEASFDLVSVTNLDNGISIL